MKSNKESDRKNTQDERSKEKQEKQYNHLRTWLTNLTGGLSGSESTKDHFTL